MAEFNSSAYAPAPLPGEPSEAETLMRQAFQVIHPEVGFARRGHGWLAYWVDGDGIPQAAEAPTLGELLGGLAEAFS